MKSQTIVHFLLFSLAAFSAVAQADDSRIDPATLERGRYLVVTGGCNDCHTPGYPEAGGKIPQSQWLVGNTVGFQGPWGTSYPQNLRLKAQSMTEKEWLARARTPMLPPMPWFNLRAAKDADLIAMYRFIRALGPAGEPAPATAAPGMAVNTPYIEFVPKNLPRQARADR